MNYSELVESYIKKSGLSLAEIAKRMEVEKGIKIDRSYISKLKNDPKYPATEEINRALAEITGGDPEALMMAGYYEKAPQEVKKTLNKASIYEKFIEYLFTKRPLKVEAIPQEGEEIDYVQLEEFRARVNTPHYLASMDEETLNDVLSKLFNEMQRKYPDDFKEFIESLSSHFTEAIKKADLPLDRPARTLIPYEPSNMLRIPVIGSRPGYQIDRREHNEGYTLVDPQILPDGDGFALCVQEDSMSGDRILEGDIIIAVKQEVVDPNDLAVVAVGEEEKVTLRRVKPHGDMVMLVPSNPAYEPQLLPAKDVAILGKVVEVKYWPK